MNIKEYISSGIIESYVLGLASPEEMLEFENLCLKFPELVSARTRFEIAMEEQLLAQAIAPAAGVKEKVMEAIRQPSSLNQSKIITMESSNNRNSSPLRFVAAAAVLLLLASAYFAYDFYTKNKELEQELVASKSTQDQLSKDLEKLEMVTDPNVAVINLKGMAKAPNSSASVYWDSTSSNVYLVAKNMPKPASEKQYQLWAIINGLDGNPIPTDLGLFDVGDDGKIIIKIDKKVKKADAFAITIENRGNSGGPNLEELQTMGETRL